MGEGSELEIWDMLLDAAVLTELAETHAAGAGCTKLEKENASQRLITQPVVGTPKKGTLKGFIVKLR